MVYVDFFLSHCCPVIHTRLMNELAMAFVMLILTSLMKVGTFHENRLVVHLCITLVGFVFLGKPSVVQRTPAEMSRNWSRPRSTKAFITGPPARNTWKIRFIWPLTFQSKGQKKWTVVRTCQPILAVEGALGLPKSPASLCQFSWGGKHCHWTPKAQVALENQ